MFRFGPGGRGRLGVTVQELSGQLGEYFGATAGVLVTAVDDDTPASQAGIKAGDVITRVGGMAVRTAPELQRRLADADGEVEIVIVREKKEQTIRATVRRDERVQREARRIVR
jgi:serine protease Do